MQGQENKEVQEGATNVISERWDAAFSSSLTPPIPGSSGHDAVLDPCETQWK